MAVTNSSKMSITLGVTQGPNQGMKFTFEEHSTFLVGRSPQAQFAIPETDRYFSRNHFLIEINPPLCRLVDLNSRNGTYVNGDRVQSTDLKNGDQIQAGHTTLDVSLQNAGAEEQLLAPDEPGRTYTQMSTIRPAPLAAADSHPRLPGYTIVKELGRGGMGVVYQARRDADGALVAVKTVLPVLDPTEEMLSRFLREVEIMKALDHAHIVKLHDSGYAGEELFFVMDFVEGSDAGMILKAQGSLAIPRAVTLTCQLLDAIAYAHGKGFIHRDIKPSNMLVTSQGGQEMVKLADFGLARAYHTSQLSGLTLTGKSGGTPSFMPPEQVLDFRTAKPAADQYAAAATMYRLLTNMPLYDGFQSNTDLLLRILQEDPIPIGKRRPDLPDGLTSIIDRALSREVEQRYPDVGALRQALLPFAMN